MAENDSLHTYSPSGQFVGPPQTGSQVASSVLGLPPNSRKSSNIHGGQSSAAFQAASVSQINKSLASLDPKRELQSSSALEAPSLWQNVCLRVLPLFNGESIKGCIEDLNELVNTWAKETPNQIISNELAEMLDAGMLTLTNKLHHQTKSGSSASLNESVLLAARLSELWSFFFGSVLPMIQGAFLPLRIPKSKNADFEVVDVRNVALLSFRENVVLPLSAKLEDAFPNLPPVNGTSSTDISGRLRQMFLVLNSIPPKLGKHSSSKAVMQLLISLNNSLKGQDARSSVL